MNPYEHGFSDAPPLPDDQDLVARAGAAFRLSMQQFGGHGTSFWGKTGDRYADFQPALDGQDDKALGDLLRDPTNTELFYGFDTLVGSISQELKESTEARRHHAQIYYDALVRVAVAVGTIRLPYDEAGQTLPQPPVEHILEGLDARFGFRIDFPNPFKGEFGLATSRGIAGHRAIHALYQVWRMKTLADSISGGCILEIGAGLGRNAYYARMIGLSDYTIVDIPMTQLAQSYFLGRVLGEKEVSFQGEPDGPVRLRSPEWLHSGNNEFDVVLNVDSLTEMDREHALTYVRVGHTRSRSFLSINHEFNPGTAAEIMAEAEAHPVMRSPYYPRPGYVEELAIPYIRFLETERDALHAEIERIKSSRSWRVTEPLRRLRGTII